MSEQAFGEGAAGGGSPEPVPLPEVRTGERLERRRAHRRRAREQLLVAFLILVVLGLTIVLLLSKWVGGASGPSGSVPASAPTIRLAGGMAA